jgi:hypothetical protein
MRNVIVTIEGISPYSQSKHHTTPKEGQETADAHERRTWRNRMHTDSAGRVTIPPMAFKNGLVSAAKFLGLKIKGAGNKTYTKRFESGVLCMEPMTLDVLAADVPAEELFVPSDGVRGSGKRVTKLFGKIDAWGGSVPIVVIDEALTTEIVEQHLEAMGMYIGLGRFRPEKNGFYGRFAIKRTDWS